MASINDDANYKDPDQQQQRLLQAEQTEGQPETLEKPKEPREGFDKITVRAVLTMLGGWCILLIIGAQLAWGN